MIHGDSEQTISDRLLEVGGGLIIAIPSATVDVPELDLVQLASVRAWFFRVSRASRLYLEYDQIGSMDNEDTEPTDGFDFLGDTGIGSGDDELRVRRDDFHVYHFGVGLHTPDLRVYYSTDPQVAADRARELQADQQDVDPGDDEQYYDGRHIPDRFDPPAFTERVAFRVGTEGEFLQWAFEAQDDLTSAETELILTGRAYKLLPVTDPGLQDAMLAEAMDARTGRHTEFPVTFHQVGGIQTWSLGNLTPDGWDESHRRTVTLGIAE